MTKERKCLDCVFLTIQGREPTRPERIMLSTHGKSAVMPAHSESVRCFKSLWDYELNYFGDTFEGVCAELERARDKCSGFAPYEAGLTPAEHLESQVEQRKEKLQWRIAKLAFFGSVTVLIIKWLLEQI